MTNRYRDPAPGLVEQTAILKDAELPEVRVAAAGEAQVTVATYPWLVLLTQECDIVMDRAARDGKSLSEGKPPVSKDKLLRSLLLCPAFGETHVLAGTYVEGASKADGNTRKMIQTNRHERFHRLPPDEKFDGEALVLDFKLVLGIGPEFLHSLVRSKPDLVVAVLCPPYRDRLMQRFLNYFGRIAEPEDQ